LKLKDRHILWPVYFDVEKTRAEGRKISKSIAVKSPTLHEIERACQALGLDPQVRSEVCYPRRRLRQGYVMVKRVGHKLDTLKKVAMKIREVRKGGA
jgi:signal recognition particle subunit SRP19